MRARYMPWRAGADGLWRLLDWKQMDFCSLPGEGGERLPLTWKSRASAVAWLQQCYRTWSVWEKDGGGEVPADWRPRPEVSPYTNGLPIRPRKD